MAELKPCPFCGDKNIAIEHFVENDYIITDSDKRLLTSRDRYRVHCRICGCGTFNGFYEDDVITAWNMRNNEAPTVDAVEVVHGRWEWRNTNEYTAVLTCSVCSRTEGADERHKYCPNCGAKMDGERRNNGTESEA